MNRLPPELKLRLLETASNISPSTLAALSSTDRIFHTLYSTEATQRLLVQNAASALIPPELFEMCWATSLLPDVRRLVPREVEGGCSCCGDGGRREMVMRRQLEDLLGKNEKRVKEAGGKAVLRAEDLSIRVLKGMIRTHSMICTIEDCASMLEVANREAWDITYSTRSPPSGHVNGLGITYVRLICNTAYTDSIFEASYMGLEAVLSRALGINLNALFSSATYQHTFYSSQCTFKKLLGCYAGPYPHTAYKLQLKAKCVELGIVRLPNDLEGMGDKYTAAMEMPGCVFLENAGVEGVWRACCRPNERLELFSRACFTDHFRHEWPEELTSGYSEES